jgi:hypothetical protein
MNTIIEVRRGEHGVLMEVEPRVWEKLDEHGLAQILRLADRALRLAEAP